MTVACINCGGATRQRTDSWGDKEHNCTSCGLVTYVTQPDSESAEDII